MRITIVLVFLLHATLVCAETKITEYPDRYVVEITGSPGQSSSIAKSESVAESAEDGTAEQRAALGDEIRRLQKERQDLLKTREGDPPGEVKRKRQEAQEKQKEISRISAEVSRLRSLNAGNR